MSTNVKNPVLSGFHPDPSILRVGNDFYIANSTFEYFPGVRVHHSTDLVNWKHLTSLLDNIELLNMKGNPRSGGIWAPCLSYSDGIFYLVYTDTKMWENSTPYKDTPNYITTAENIMGPWSEPVYLNSSGFDGSMFHDDDGKKYYMNMLWDYRQNGIERFAGIVMQEYDIHSKKLIGERKNIFKGSPLGLTEGPHIYKQNGYYYLMVAEGGTSYDHAVTVARSKNIWGPYQLPEKYPMLTSRNKDVRLQKAGHGSLVEDNSGNWYLAYLCARPLPNTNRCVLGRETSIANVIWEDDWPIMKNGTNSPDDYFASPFNVEKQVKDEYKYAFDDTTFLDDFNTLRNPFSKEVYSVKDGYLYMRGCESIMSCHDQSALLRRQTDFKFSAQTKIHFEPKNFQQMAGLLYRYDEHNQYYLYLTYDENENYNYLEIQTVDRGIVTFDSNINKITLASSNDLYFKLDVDYTEGQFSYSYDNKMWYTIGDKIDTSILSDEYGNPPGFTGAFVGMCCQDLSNKTAVAKFEEFIYKVKD